MSRAAVTDCKGNADGEEAAGDHCPEHLEEADTDIDGGYKAGSDKPGLEVSSDGASGDGCDLDDMSACGSQDDMVWASVPEPCGSDHVFSAAPQASSTKDSCQSMPR